jgi:tRNA(adenine34) deaminase
MSQSDRDVNWMKLALAMAKGASKLGEVPVAAVVIMNDQILASGINLREANRSPILHAEIVAINAASKRLNAWRLSGCTLYVTLEPCLMCAGAIYQSRIDRIVYAASDPKAGAYESLYAIGSDVRLNHRPVIHGGLMADHSRRMLREFFQTRRRENQDYKDNLNGN